MSQEVTLTVRLIRSFEHRNIRPIVLKAVPLESTIDDFKNTVFDLIKNSSNLPPPVKNYSYDTFKIMHKAHGWKSNDPVINTENDESFILKSEKTLKESGVEHETELSFFKLEDYMKYKETLSSSLPS